VPEKSYKPSPWEHPELYEKGEPIHVEPERERSLREYIEMQLSASGFAVDQHPDGIQAWPRGSTPDINSYVIGHKGDVFVVKSAKGSLFTRKKTKMAIDQYLKQWAGMYKIGARK